MNAADIETIFGKGTEVEELEPLEIDFANNNEADGEETPFELWYNPVSEMEAGCPYRIRPTDALASPITLQHVRVTRKEPWSFHQGGILISGTFQKTDEAQAFSAILTDDPNSIGEMKSEELRMKNEGAWYDLDGKKKANNNSSQGILVTTGRKVLW